MWLVNLQPAILPAGLVNMQPAVAAQDVIHDDVPVSESDSDVPKVCARAMYEKQGGIAQAGGLQGVCGDRVRVVARRLCSRKNSDQQVSSQSAGGRENREVYSGQKF